MDNYQLSVAMFAVDFACSETATGYETSPMNVGHAPECCE